MWLGLSAVSIIWAALGLATWGMISCSATAGPVAAVARVEPDGTLTMSGGIDAALLAAVEKALANTSAPIRRIRLNSFGGQTEFMDRIAGLVRPLHAVIEVPDGATCQSACVGLLAKAGGPVIVGPRATLMFHSAAARYGLAQTGPCGWLNNLAVRVSMGWRSLKRRLNPGIVPDMLPWAEALSPALPVLFDMCGTNPLWTSRGMTLTGAEFNGLRDGSVSPDRLLVRCPE